jgi:hypothetical protein
MPFAAQGILDGQLFNITDLISDEYDDAHRDALPLIVSYTHPADARRAAAVPEGATRIRNLDAIQGAALTANRSHAADFWKSVAGAATADGARTQSVKPSFGDGISRIWLDGLIHADLADSTAQIGAQQVWQGGDTRQGVDRRPRHRRRRGTPGPGGPRGESAELRTGREHRRPRRARHTRRVHHRRHRCGL